MSDSPGKEDLAKTEESLQQAVENSDSHQVAEIIDSISSHEALRFASKMEPADRDQLVTMLEPEIAA